MNDTSLEIQRMMREMLMKRSGEERFIMGTLMFNAAREIYCRFASAEFAAG